MTWNYVYTPYIWPMLASAVVSAALGVYAFRHRTTPGATPFAVQNLAVAVWAFFTAVEIAAVTLSEKILYHKLEAVAGVITVGAMLVFALERANPGRRANRLALLLISFSTLLMFLMMLTNDLHHLMWSGFYFDQFLRVERGPLNILMVAWVLFLPFAGLLIFLWLLIRSRGIYRRQAAALFIGGLLPILTFFLELSGRDPLAPLDPVILMWNVTSVLYALAIFRFGLLEIIPVGRDSAIERMENGVLILDADHRIVDFNPAAGNVLGLSRKAAIGRPAGQALASKPALSRLLAQKLLSSGEVTMEREGQSRIYQVQASSLTHPGGFQMGWLVLFQDVTDQRRVQLQMIEQQRAMAMLQERERLARELHDSTGQVLGFTSLQIGASRKLIADGKLEKADEQLATLENIVAEAHADVREDILNLRSALTEDKPFFSALRQYLDGFRQNYGIAVDIAIQPAVKEEMITLEGELQMFRILQEALSNARRHAKANCIHVSLALDDGFLLMRVEDNGQGFDPQLVVDGNHFGLRFMKERAEQLGGSLLVQSVTGQGTTIEVAVPVNGKGEIK